MPSAKPTDRQELRALLGACRTLMGTLLTLSQERRDGGWTRHLPVARRRVEEATRCIRDHGRLDEPVEEVERLAGSMARIFVQDMLDGGKHEGAAPDAPAERDGLRGHTWAFAVPDVLSFLQVQAKTGTLRVNIGSEVISLVLVEGELVHAYSDNSPPGLRLGEILVERGHMEPAELERLLVEVSATGERLGEALLERGRIDRAQLEDALEFQIRLIFVRLLCSGQAYFSFHVGTDDDAPASRFDVMSLLADASRIQNEAIDGAE